MTHLRLAFVLQAFALLLVAGCGDDSSGSSMDAAGGTDATGGADAPSVDDGRVPRDSPVGADTGGRSLAGVDLGAAGGFVILAKSGISTVPASAVTGNVGVSPAAATFITGFSMTADSTNEFSTSPQV